MRGKTQELVTSVTLHASGGYLKKCHTTDFKPLKLKVFIYFTGEKIAVKPMADKVCVTTSCL